MTQDEISRLLQPIRIAKIIGLEKHPNADRLQIVRVDLGDELKSVITGAQNIKEGDLVPYLGEGNIIPGYLIMKGEKIVLEKRMLRGLESDSMILSEDEIGLSDDHTGIFIIKNNDPDSIIGKKFVDLLSEADLESIMANAQL